MLSSVMWGNSVLRFHMIPHTHTPLKILDHCLEASWFITFPFRKIRHQAFTSTSLSLWSFQLDTWEPVQWNLNENEAHLWRQSNMFYDTGSIFHELFCSCIWMVPFTWWRHQMEAVLALLALCDRNPLVDSPHKGPVTCALMFSLMLV